MAQFLVTWSIDVEAGDAREAAEAALLIQRRPDSIATVFVVQEHEASAEQTIDLLVDEDGVPE